MILSLQARLASAPGCLLAKVSRSHCRRGRGHPIVDDVRARFQTSMVRWRSSNRRWCASEVPIVDGAWARLQSLMVCGRGSNRRWYAGEAPIVGGVP